MQITALTSPFHFHDKRCTAPNQLLLSNSEPRATLKARGVLTMNRCWIVAAFGTAIALAGCAQTAQDENTDVYKRSGNTINVADRNELYNENGVPNGDDTR